MSKENQGCNIIFNSSSDVQTRTLKEYPVLGISGTTANGGSVPGSNDTTTTGDLTTDSSAARTTNICTASVQQPIVSSSKTSNSGCTLLGFKDLDFLEKEFLRDPNLTLTRQREIAKFIQKREDQVRTWFENRRQKQKKEEREAQQSQHTPRTGGAISKLMQWFDNWSESMATSEFSNSLLQITQSDNQSPDQVSVQKVKNTPRKHPLVPNCSKQISRDGHVIPQPEQQHNGSKAGKDRNLFPFNTGLITSKQEHQIKKEVLVGYHPFVSKYQIEKNGDREVVLEKQLLAGGHVGSDQYRSLENTRINKQNSAHEQKLVASGHPFVPNYSREVKVEEGTIPKQEKLPNCLQAGRDSHRPLINTSTSKQDVTQQPDIAVRDHLFVPNYYREVNGKREKISKQQQLRNGHQKKRDIRRSPVDRSTSKQDPVQGQNIVIIDHQFAPNYYREVNGEGGKVPKQEKLRNFHQAGKYIHHSSVNTSKQDLAQGQNVVITEHPVPYYQTEINRDGNGYLRQQQQLLNSRKLKRDRCCSPVKTSQNINEQDPAQEQKVIVREHPVDLSYSRDVNRVGNKVSQQDKQIESRQVVKDRYCTSVHPGSSTTRCDPVPLLEDGIIFRDQQFIPNFYGDVNGICQCQQFPEVRYTESDCHRCALNPSPHTKRLHPILGPEVGYNFGSQVDAYDGRFYQLQPAITLPWWYQHPYYNPFSTSLVYGGNRF